MQPESPVGMQKHPLLYLARVPAAACRACGVSTPLTHPRTRARAHTHRRRSWRLLVERAAHIPQPHPSIPQPYSHTHRRRSRRLLAERDEARAEGYAARSEVLCKDVELGNMGGCFVSWCYMRCSMLQVF